MRLPYTTIAKDPELAASQLSTNARMTNDALARKVSGTFVYVSRYQATGQDPKIRLGTFKPAPKGALLVNAQLTRNPSLPTLAAAHLPVTYEEGAAVVREPSGLTIGELYDLTFLVLE